MIGEIGKEEGRSLRGEEAEMRGEGSVNEGKGLKAAQAIEAVDGLSA